MPSQEEITRYLSERYPQHYQDEDRALKILFSGDFRGNKKFEHVLLKVAALNTFYSTNIKGVYRVAEHIYQLDIDERLEAGDPTLVKDIAKVTFRDKTYHFYSFATKYCADHYPDYYPIYDSFVDDMLRSFRTRDGLLKFKNDELKDYVRFKAIIDDFIRVYKLPETTSYRDLDHYLWLLGKDIAGVL